MIDLFNSGVSLALALVFAWGIMSHRVRDGVVIKIGLICMSLGFLGAWGISMQTRSQANIDGLEAVHTLIYIGLIVCVVGYMFRRRRESKRTAGNSRARRVSDWVDL
jgi:hypothetical protein